MKRDRHFVLTAMLVGALLIGLPAGSALADGDETLGPPSIAIADGTGVVAAGTGLFSQPGMIQVDVPLGSAVNQVLLYWYGRGGAGDNEIVVEGVPVTGDLIGEDNTTALPFQVSHTYRADITALGLVGPGTNMLQVSGMDRNPQRAPQTSCYLNVHSVPEA